MNAGVPAAARRVPKATPEPPPLSQKGQAPPRFGPSFWTAHKTSELLKATTVWRSDWTKVAAAVSKAIGVAVDGVSCATHFVSLPLDATRTVGGPVGARVEATSPKVDPHVPAKDDAKQKDVEKRLAAVEARVARLADRDRRRRFRRPSFESNGGAPLDTCLWDHRRALEERRPRKGPNMRQTHSTREREGLETFAIDF